VGGAFSCWSWLGRIGWKLHEGTQFASAVGAPARPGAARGGEGARPVSNCVRSCTRPLASSRRGSTGADPAGCGPAVLR